MAALTAEAPLDTFHGEGLLRPLATAIKAYKNSFLSVNAAGSYFDNLAAGEVFGGLCVENIDNSAGANGEKEALAVFKPIRCTVLGATIASVGEKVYAINNNPNDCTLTVGTNTLVGYVMQWFSGTTCIVALCEPGSIEA